MTSCLLEDGWRRCLCFSITGASLPHVIHLIIQQSNSPRYKQTFPCSNFPPNQHPKDLYIVLEYSCSCHACSFHKGQWCPRCVIQHFNLFFSLHIRKEHANLISLYNDVVRDLFKNTHARDLILRDWEEHDVGSAGAAREAMVPDPHPFLHDVWTLQIYFL